MKSKRNPRTCPYYEIAIKRTCIIVASISDLEKKDVGDTIVRALCDAYEAGQLPESTESDETLLDVIRRLEDPALGMSWVPDVVRALGNQDVLMAGYRDGLVELRPESGMGRLSPVDAALCPAAIDGTPLSWVRVL